MAIALSVGALMPLFTPNCASASEPAAPYQPESLRIGVLRSGWPPFVILDKGRLTGFSVDVFKSVWGPAPPVLRPILFDSMADLIDAACEGSIDLVLEVSSTPDRERCLKFTAPYFDGDAVVIGRVDADVTSLPRASIAVERGFLMQQTLQKRFPNARLVFVDSVQNGLSAVEHGIADFYVTLDPVAGHAFAEHPNRSLKALQRYREPSGAIRIGVSAALPPGMLQRLDAGVQKLAPSRLQSILGRWVQSDLTNSEAAASTFFVTEEERQFLAQLPPLRVVVDAGLPPYSFIDDSGRRTGIAVDYLGLISRTLGIQFQLVPAGPFSSDVQRALSHEVDILSAVARDDSVLRGLQVTKPYATFPVVIVGKRSTPPVISVKDLSGKRLAVTYAGGVSDWLRNEVPKATIESYQSVHDAMEAVESGAADAYVDDLASADVGLQRGYGGSLKLLGGTGKSLDIGFAIAPQYADHLIPLFNRVLATLPQPQRLALENRYFSASYVLGPDLSDLAARAAVPAALALIVIVVLLRSRQVLRREVAERRRAESLLEGELRFQRTLLDAVPVPVVVRDTGGTPINKNEAFNALETWPNPSPSVEANTTLPSRGLGNLLAQLTDLERRASAEKLPIQAQLEIFDEESKQHFFLCWIRPFLHATQQREGVISSVIEVTEIRAAELAARAARAMLDDVTRNLPATVFQLQHTPTHDIAVQWVSGNVRALFGVSAEEIKQSGFTPFLLTTDALRLQQAMEVCLTEGMPVSLECNLRAGETTRWARIQMLPRQTPEGRTVWTGYWVDTTAEHQHAETLSEARDAAEAASKAKSEFLATMSHEIRTPMSGVIGLIDLLADTQLDSNQQATVELLQDSAAALLQILSDILDYSKIESGHIELETVELDVRELTDVAVRILSKRAHDKDVRMRLSVGRDVPISALGDGARIQQILFNLLSNAIKFTDKGEVSIHVSCEPAPPGLPRITWTIRDTGIGLSPEQVAKLFSPFTQADASTTRRFGGTGLGLAICRRLASLMGGEVSLAGVPNKGATATLSLPLQISPTPRRLGPLAGIPVRVDIQASAIRSALEDYLSAADAAISTPPGRTPHILLTDQPEIGEEEIDTQRAVILVTMVPKAAGFRSSETGFRLSANPLTWTATIRVIKEAWSSLDTHEAPASGRDLGLATTAPAGPTTTSDLPVLVAEDHVPNRIVLQRQLAKLGYTSEAAENGLIALKKAQEKRYFALITDCHMPEMNGYELASAIRNSEKQSGSDRLPIIALTASTEVEEVLRCKAAGMDECLFKPVSVEDLSKTLSALQGNAFDKST